MGLFLQQVSNIVEREQLLAPGDCVVVGVSGGADSVALLSVLRELGYRCIAAHCNFHLRGDESERDMKFVVDLCRKLNVKLELTNFDTNKYCCDKKVSVEMACRELRYEWFETLREKYDAKAIAVGHHKEDRVETFFINLLRGAGITGLTSMRPRSGCLVRPLLDCSREDIERYLSKLEYSWVDDSTNSCDNFVRNRLRNRILPLLDESFDGASESVLRSISNLSESKRFYDRAVEEKLCYYVDDETGAIDLVRLGKENIDARLLLFEWLRSEGFSRQQTDDMFVAANSFGGKFTAGTTCRDVDHGLLRPAYMFEVVDNTPVEIKLNGNILAPVRIVFSLHEIDEFKPTRNPNVIYLDESANADENNWQLRRWHKGDRMVPFGKKKSKLLSDIFADAHLSAKEKSEIWLLTCNDEIVWVVGLKPSAHFAINSQSKRYIKLEIK